MSAPTIYEFPAQSRGTFKFNDHVCMELVLLPIEVRTGRLVQVRKGVGAFGSDIHLVRLRDGSLMSFENALMRKVGDRDFEQAFYTSNGQAAPVIPEQPVFPDDSVETAYTIKERYPETGFIVEHPTQPPSHPRSFTLAITKP